MLTRRHFIEAAAAVAASAVIPVQTPAVATPVDNLDWVASDWRRYDSCLTFTKGWLTINGEDIELQDCSLKTTRPFRFWHNRSSNLTQYETGKSEASLTACRVLSASPVRWIETLEAWNKTAYVMADGAKLLAIRLMLDGVSFDQPDIWLHHPALQEIVVCTRDLQTGHTICHDVKFSLSGFDLALDSAIGRGRISSLSCPQQSEDTNTSSVG